MTDPSSPIDWTADGAPHSRLFDDVYFSSVDGLAESRAVFLEGCGLPGAWTGRRSFVVGELGFGTGLNILALLDLWRRTRGIGARLNVFSIEAHPLTAEEAGRALAAWPELGDLSALLIERWPRRARGFHRLDLPELGATLDLAIMDAAEALAQWTGRADAWFLDGFAPARNPGMWSDEVLAGVAGVELVAVPAPSVLRDDRGWVDYSYINHYVVNGGVILCGFDDPSDEVAADILAQCYPDREVVLVDARPIFDRGGGIHCITQQQPSPK